MEMELKMGEMQLPEQVSFNYEELKQELTEKVSMYETLVYTDDQIKQAKADKASLNKLKKALNDERIKREKEYMVPFNVFKAQVNEIIGIIDRPIAIIDKQVKEYEEAKKAEKKAEIIALFNMFDAPEELNFEKMFDPKWLNASVSLASIRSEMEFLIENFKANLKILSNLPEFAFEAKQTYISTLNLQDALNEAHRMSEMAKLKAQAAAEVKAIMEEPQIEEEHLPFTDEEPEWKYYQIKMTPAQMLGMESYFISKGIEFKRI